MQHMDIVKKVLAGRGIRSEEEVDGFLNASVSDLPAPFELPCIKKACDVLKDSLSREEKIFVYGDGDVDGICASFFLIWFLEKTLPGFSENDWHLTHRLDDDYEIEENTINFIKDEGYSLLIAADCGTSSVEALKLAEKHGIRCIVLDHHLGDRSNLPDYHVYVNPRIQEGWPEGSHDISSASIAYYFIKGMELLTPGVSRYCIGDALELPAIATLADYLPLQGANRVFVREGLKRLPFTDIKGLAFFLEHLGIKNRPSQKDVNMKLNPRLNSPGRLGKPRIVVNLFLEREEREIRRLVSEIESIDRERYRIKVKGFKKADVVPGSERGFIISRDIEPGVCGIVASRLTEKHKRPFLVGCEQGDILKGSIRAPEGYNLFENLQPLSCKMLSMGGHNNAMGFKCLTGLREEIESFWNRIDWGKPAPRDYDCYLDIEDITPSIVDEIHSVLEPYGRGNPPPVFFSRGVYASTLRRGGDTMSGNFWIKKGSAAFEARLDEGGEGAIDFNREIDILYTPRARETNGLFRIWLEIRGYLVSESA